MTLRQIAPMSSASMRGIAPAVDIGALPVLDWADPRVLYVEEEYQRGLFENSIALIRRVIAGWNWARVKPAVCVRSGGRLVVIDGQHTAIAAAMHGAIKKIPIVIVEAKTVKDRATAFIGQNRDRLALTPAHLHYASLAAGDEVAVAVDEACRKAGAIILKAGRGPRGVYKVGETFAVGIISRVTQKVGVAASVRLLKVLIDAKRAPLPASEIGAVAILMFDPQYKGKIDFFDLATVIRSRSVSEWKAVAASLRSKGTPARITLATAFLSALKKGH